MSATYCSVPAPAAEHSYAVIGHNIGIFLLICPCAIFTNYVIPILISIALQTGGYYIKRRWRVTAHSTSKNGAVYISSTMPANNGDNNSGEFFYRSFYLGPIIFYRLPLSFFSIGPPHDATNR